MDTNFYLDKFHKAAGQLSKEILHKKQIEVAVGMFLNSVVIKLYKKSWANPLPDALTAESRIFFSVWVHDTTIGEQKIFYNIHALKLRKLKGYTIESRKFADAFRAGFKKSAPQWPNVSVQFGPLTLMEGWIKIDMENLQEDVFKLANNFLALEHLIDTTLKKFKKD